MIIDAVIGVFVKLMEWFTAMVPSFEMPAFIASGPAKVQELLTSSGALGNWLPVELLPMLVPPVFATIVVALGIRVARMIFSAATTGGGMGA